MKDKYDYILSAVGVAWSIQDLQNIVSLILLIISLINILWKTGYNIYTKIKNNKVDEIGEDISKCKDEIQQLQENINDKKEEK